MVRRNRKSSWVPKGMTGGQKVLLVLLSKELEEGGGVSSPQLSREDLENIYKTGENPPGVDFNYFVERAVDQNLLKTGRKGLQLTHDGSMTATAQAIKLGGLEEVACQLVPATA